MTKHGSKPPQIREAFDEWYSTVEHLSPTTIYNLAFAEQLEGRWQGMGETASNIFYESFTPFCNRTIIETICSLPNEKIHGGTLRSEIIERLWPELLETRFSKPGFFLSKYLPRAVKDQAKYLLSGNYRRYVRSGVGPSDE